MPQKTRRKLFISVAILSFIAFLGWFVTPIYGFKAHQGKLPLPLFGWVEVPDDAPVDQQLYDPAYADQAARALGALRLHREAIDAPALSAAVAIDGQVVWAAAVGWADIASRQSATPRTRFRIGSTSKAITATLLARLTEQRVVDLDQPIGAYWSPLPNPLWRTMTLRHLASHQSGLPHYKENTDWRGLYASIALNQHFADVRDAVTVFDQSELLFEPGNGFHYSTLGTVLLAAVLSQATDTPYRDLITEQVLTPLGIESVAVSPPTSTREPEIATFYYAQGQRMRPWRAVDLTHRLPGGGFVATPVDLAKLGMAWLDERYLSKRTRDTFWAPQVLASGKVNEQNYALGFRWSRWESPQGAVYVHANHGGVSRGAQSWLMILPQQRMSLAFSINRNTEEFGEFGSVYGELLTAFSPVE